jgi:hypothetical protein
MTVDMYTALLFVHSWLRWVVIFSGVAALGGAVGGVSTGRAWLPADNVRSLLFTISLDVQSLIGLILYGALSPVTRSGFADLGLAMRDPVLRFFTIEHVFGMLVALAFAHVGRVRMRRASDDRARHRTVLIFVGLAMVSLLVSIPWPGMPAGREMFRGLR